VSSLDALASRLRRLRQRHELTQEEFAEAIGLSYKFYQQIEAGRKKQIWLETVERLAAGFGLEAWQLLAPDEPTDTKVHSGTRGEKTVGHKAVAVPIAPYRVKPTTRRNRSKQRQE
jgi:transcriptional regulator with XRE-family HTH domain